MRNWQDWHKPLVEALYSLLEDGSLVRLEKRDCARLFEIEMLIMLHERINSPLSLKDTWALTTGYVTPEVAENDQLRQQVAIARNRVRYLRTKTTFNRHLNWYAELPATIRLYDVSLESSTYSRRAILHHVPQRIQAIEAALSTSAEHTPIKEQVAKADTEYAFSTDTGYETIRIPAELINAANTLASKTTLQQIPKRNQPRPSIIIQRSELHQAAIELNVKLPKRDWLRWVENFELRLVATELVPADSFTIDGLFHLLGPTGAGKSTLIYLILYLLCQKNSDFRVTVIANTVTDALNLASELEQAGIKAAPILGRDRQSHRYQYGMAHRDELDPGVLFNPQAPELANPALHWLTGTCILSGLVEEGITPGQEPCHNLVSIKTARNQRKPSSTYTCPLMPICPVHQANRDLLQAQVWIATPAAFLFTAMPLSLSGTRIRALEATYYFSDLLIIDEVDRVQVSIEERFAQATDLTGSQKSTLDTLEMVLTEQEYRTGKTRLNDKRHRELKVTVREASRLADWLLGLLFDYTHLRSWAEAPLYNTLVYDNLVETVRSLTPAEVDPTQLETALTQLRQSFESYCRHSTGELDAIVSNVKNTGELFFHQLRAWLNSELPFPLAHTPAAQTFLERLGFAVVLSALEYQVNNLLKQWSGSAPELQEGVNFSIHPPEEYVDLGIETPLGNILGYQFVDQTGEGSPRGILRYLNCHGLGRYLLLRFPYLYLSLCGDYGPHILLTSATSWSPGSPQFHVAVPPHAVLIPPSNIEAIAHSHFEFLRVPGLSGDGITVSGNFGQYRYDNLIKLVRYLSSSTGSSRSRLEQELDYWQAQGNRRGILLLTGSYSEARYVADYLQFSHKWKDLVDCIVSDRETEEDDWLLRRSLAEEFPERNKPILVTPLGSIQRGYNILDPQTQTAFLGTVFFLVRPYPQPTDFGRHIRGIHKWVTENLLLDANVLSTQLGNNAIDAITQLRSESHRQWRRRLRSSALGSAAMETEFWHELCWDQIVVIVQVLGRLTRGNVPIRAFFCDSAFHPKDARRSLIQGWTDILADYLAPGSTKPLVEQQLAQLLYWAVYDRLLDLQKRLT
ncbi:MAG: hypothetical protein KME27_20855 [Lyngbya sp. HA4199-MV5]|jgi:hypothetical protein|nr:hypothetical protein [Lyngbya sp. HA4199-MV5]